MDLHLAPSGLYPQNDGPPPTWQERVVAGASRPFRAWAAERSLDRALPRIEALGDALGSLDDDGLRREVASLRRELRREGLRDPLAARCFALVRELAQRKLGQRHYPTQLVGGWIMLSGMLAEMETGEGKTLTATLPAATVALAGMPVHIVTPNDYLATRDAEAMGPVYRAMGLSVGAITEDLDTAARQAAYACDVTYCCNKQLAFDYLRDRMLLGQRPAPLQLQVERLYAEQPRVDRLLLRGLYFAIVDEADSVLVDEARTPLIISGPSESGEEERIYAQAIEMARDLQASLHYEHDPRSAELRITDEGRAQIEALSEGLGGLWEGRRRREDLMQKALTALHIFHRDRHYLVRDGKVQIIDEYTGRVMADRSWERGLHQMIETKEGCELSGRRQTLARISYQRFFPRYLRLAGMTGTAREVSGELWSVYGLRVRRVPTHRPVRRRIGEPLVYVSAEAKWQAAVERVAAAQAAGRPVLIGTRSVAASERLSALLQEAGLEHVVLNARQDADEAAIIARAGEQGCITVATNMAGRGADIKLGPGVAELGGLLVVSTEPNDARRIDRQLYGRCARQGDPGGVETLASLEDEIPAAFLPPGLRQLLGDRTRLPGWLGRGATRLPQRLTERRHARARRELQRLDEHVGNLLAFSGRME